MIIETYRFRCAGYRSVLAESSKDAATAFASRTAKRHYGSGGYCHHVRLDSYAANGKQHNYEAFIGKDVKGGGCSGHNIWLYVWNDGDSDNG